MMIANPEFKRLTWLELTPHRLLALPVMLALIFTLLALGAEHPYPAVATAALVIFALLCPLWGARLAVESVSEEIRDKTWDTQRMSALTPWELTIGKLLGSNVFTWFGGGLCLLVYAVADSRAGFTIPTLTVLGLVVGLTLLVHSLSLFLTLLAVRRNREPRSSIGLLSLLAILYISSPLLIMARPEYRIIEWYGLPLDRLDLILWSLWIFAAWMIVAAWRVMCEAMQERTTPAAWLAFAAFLSLYLAGFVGPSATDSAMSGPNRLLAVAFAVTLSMSYLAMWWDAKDSVSVRRFLRLWNLSDHRRLAEEMPCWLATLIPALAIAVLLIPGGGFTLPIGRTIHATGWTAIALLLYMLRDAGVLYLCCLNPGSRRGESTALFYLGLAYLVIPWLLKMAGLDAAFKLALPPAFENPFGAIAILLLHIVAVAYFIRRRWLRTTRKAAPAGDLPVNTAQSQ